MVIHVSPIRLIIKFRIVIIFQTQNPTSFEHMFFGYPFLESQHTTYYPNIGVQLREVIDLGMSTLILVTNSFFVSY